MPMDAPFRSIRPSGASRRVAHGQGLDDRFEAPTGAQLVDLVDRALEGLAPGAGQILVGPLGALEAAGHHVDLLGELLPLQAEPTEALQDLVADLLDAEG